MRIWTIPLGWMVNYENTLIKIHQFSCWMCWIFFLFFFFLSCSSTHIDLVFFFFFFLIPEKHALNKRKHYSKVQHYSKWWRSEKRVYSSQVGFLVWLQTWSSPLLLLRIIILSKPSSLALKTASLTASWIAR